MEEEGRASKSPGMAYLESDVYTSRVGGRTEKKEKWIWDTWMMPNKQQKKTMLALMMREMVKTMVTNHVYLHQGQLYRQERGGPIGLSLTQELSRVVLRRYNKQYAQELTKLNIKPILHKRYADDVNKAARKIPLNISLAKDSDGKLVLERRGREEEEEMEEEVRRDKEEPHTSSIYTEIANTVMPRSIKMEDDIPSRYASKKLPILDMEMWID